ncbi:class I SAM-dependent methyltransferase [Patiriisocius hiemis]|uniref:Class I SAM-dependent methyltransferase n=1 Tax=Patiriisocius hiemis TaxID=3075604 RepID=A0ABU2Y9C3_9FLAO|nr:class I SAM-dependent methyltransferase [Constantimarinum sp. W242]MDT0554779.1 class I SAM-dependent methyltransferase [Constantimarinum sp. W242]
MNPNLLHKEVQDFIKNQEVDLKTLAFKKSPFVGISTKELVQQIASRNKIRKKLPTWYHTENILYPPTLNLEQTSSEITAKYKASIISGNSLADITGGFGVDSYYFSKKFKDVTHFEVNESLSSLSKHNFEQLNKQIKVIAGNGLQLINNKKYDVIYIDPSRRNQQKNKVLFLEDYEPNIIEHLEHLFSITPVVLVKTSPMIDISKGVSDLIHVSEIHIVAVQNEVKELLWLLTKEISGETKLIATNHTKEGATFFKINYNKSYTATYSNPSKYLYEPNASILKSGAFNAVSEKYSLNKLAKHSHLYTSDKLVHFPGRSFVIKDLITYTKKEVNKKVTGIKANITTRNFTETVSQLKKKWKVKDGGDTYLFFTTLQDRKKVVLICEKTK